ncbi:SGNH/GDSL hydrolase family protein [Curtobacterium sp. NPDC090217]|uniref:SGNH/GDSL hydrolase family protein n=1 Tax=Curtobacterium sp. NPDC090217 TaxID=3363970 RepID=UPI0038231677
MTITLRPGDTVMFTGDSITDCQHLEIEQPLGWGYPLRVAGEWGFRHPDRQVGWHNSGISGNKVMDLEPRWERDVLDTRPDLVSLLIGANDVGWKDYAEDGYEIPAEDFRAGIHRLLTPLAERGTQLILIEPFLLPVNDAQRVQREDLDPKIQVVRELARTFGAHLLAADGLFAGLAATTGPEYWAADGVHPTPAGHAALADAWLRLVD